MKINLMPLALMALSSAYASALVGGSRLRATLPTPTVQAAEQDRQSALKQEEMQDRNEKATAENALILQANQELEARNWQQAIPLLQQLIELDASNWQLYSRLGDAQYGLGRYEDATQTYDKGIAEALDAINADRKKSVADSAKVKLGIAAMLTNEGNAFLKIHKDNDAIVAYSRAAAIAPNPATEYFNLCAVQYNTGAVDGALDACDKTIAADPNKADAYFIKGALLLSSCKQNNLGKISVPAGTIEAFTKYVELDPTGRSAKYAEEALAFISIGNNPLTPEGWSAKTEGLPEIPPSIANARLVHKVEPIYPELALISHVQGDVEFKALINTDGNIKNLQLMNGHSLLFKSAADAVAQWQYRPYFVNGEPTEVVTTITVKFHL